MHSTFPSHRPPCPHSIHTSHSRGGLVPLDKKAIEPVLLDSLSQGLYSRYFLVPKRDRGLQPIMNLRGLNLHLNNKKFHMKTPQSIFPFIPENMWMALECVFPHLNPSVMQEVPQVCIRQLQLPVCSSAFQPVLFTQGNHQGYGGKCCTPLSSRH